MSVTTVMFEVYASSVQELQELFWQEVASNHSSLQKLMTLWLQLTQSLAEKFQINSLSEKEKVAVLQFLTKFDVVRYKCTGSTNDQQSTEGSVTVPSEPRIANDDAIIAENVPPAPTPPPAAISQYFPELRVADDHVTADHTYTHPGPVSLVANIQNTATKGGSGEVKRCMDKQSTDCELVVNREVGLTKGKQGEEEEAVKKEEDTNDSDDDVDYDPADDSDGAESDAGGKKQQELKTHKINSKESKEVFVHVCIIGHCKEPFTDPWLLKKHMEITHGIRKQYVCKLCSKHFLDQSELERHVDTCRSRQAKKAKTAEHEEQVSKVGTGASTAQVDAVVNQKTTSKDITPEMQNPDNVTDEAVSSKVIERKKGDVGTSDGIKEEEDNFDLIDDDVDNESLGDAEQANKSSKAITLGSCKQVAGFVCHICKSIFDDPLVLKGHVNETHNVYKKHACTLCSQCFLRPWLLQKHMKLCSRKFNCETKGESENTSESTDDLSKVTDKSPGHVSPYNTNQKVVSSQEGQASYNEQKPGYDDDSTANKNGKEKEEDFSGSQSKEVSDTSVKDTEASSSHITLEKHGQNDDKIETPIQCGICDKVLCSRDYLKQHYLQMHLVKKVPDEPGAYKCGKCSKVCPNLRTFQKHVCSKTEDPTFHTCTLCGQKCRTKENLEKHENEEHKRIKTHFCTMCPKSFVKKCELNFHMRWEHEGRHPHVCNICGKSFAEPWRLKEHEASVHSKGDCEYPCQVCGKIWPTKHRLKQHMINHGPKKYKCDLCELAFRRNYHLKIHKDQVHHKIAEKLCQECGAAFYTEAYLRVHVNAVHKDLRPHKCQQCGHGFRRGDQLRKHVVKYHETKGEVKPPRPMYKCTECNKVLKTASMLKAHMRSHSDVREFQCDTCDMAYKTKYCLAKHKQTVHLKIKPHLCSDCGKTFGTVSILNKHVQYVHTKEKTKKKIILPCRFCDKTLPSKSELETHEAWHQGLVDLRCKTCGKECTTKHSFKQHSRIHRGDGWRCSKCGLGFKNQEECSRHKAVVHLGLTDYSKCKQCGKEFTTRQSMQRHMKNHTGAGWKCTICGEIFPTVYAQKKHRDQVHRSNTKSGVKSTSKLNVESKSNFESENEQAVTFMVTAEQIEEMIISDGSMDSLYEQAAT